VHVKKALVHSLQRRHRTKSRGWPSANKKMHKSTSREGNIRCLSLKRSKSAIECMLVRQLRAGFCARNVIGWSRCCHVGARGTTNPRKMQVVQKFWGLPTPTTTSIARQAVDIAVQHYLLGTHLTSRPHTFALTYHNGALSVSSYHMASI
jgi:hypothetical protein